MTNPSPPSTTRTAVVSSISGWLAKTVNPWSSADEVEARVVEGARRVEDRLPDGVGRARALSREPDHEQQRRDADALDRQREGDRSADDVARAAQRPAVRVDHRRPRRERRPPTEQDRQRRRRHDPEAADRDQDGDGELAPEGPVVGRVDDGEARVGGCGHRREQGVDRRGPLAALRSRSASRGTASRSRSGSRSRAGSSWPPERPSAADAAPTTSGIGANVRGVVHGSTGVGALRRQPASDSR